MRMRRIPWAAEYIETSPIRIKDPAKMPDKWREKLHCKELHVELGCGKGGYSLALATQNPDMGVVAVEMNESAAGLAARKMDEEHPENLALIFGNGAEISTWFAPEEVDALHLNFSDPWPKRRNAKRRLSSPGFLKEYRNILSDEGQIIMKTDNQALFEYSLLQIPQAGFVLSDVSVDFRRDEHPEDPITEYEQKFMEKGQPIYRAVWTKTKDEND